MIKKSRLVIALVCVLGLSACACPRPSSYEGTPYGNERTAGVGLHEEGCLKRSVF